MELHTFCAGPGAIAGSPSPSSELSNVFALYSYDSGIGDYTRFRSPIFDQYSFGDDYQEVVSEEPAYIGCIKLKPSGRDLTCRGYMDFFSGKAVTHTIWGQVTEIEVYEAATGTFVEVFCVGHADEASCPATTDGSGEFRAMSPDKIRRALIDLAAPNEPTLVRANAEIINSDDWCGAPSPLADAVAAASMASTEPALDGETESVDGPDRVLVSSDAFLTPEMLGSMSSAETIEELDWVVCLTVVPNPRNPRYECTYIGGGDFDYYVANGDVVISLVDPVTAEISASSTFPTDPRCPNVIDKKPLLTQLPGVDPAAADWLASVLG